MPIDHPLRSAKELVDAVLKGLSGALTRMYARSGRPSVPPERLLKALLLLALYSIRSERLLLERLRSDAVFRWFLDMREGEKAFNPSTLSKNRQRFIEHGITRKFFGAVVTRAQAAGLMSARHFSVDGTLVEAWASMKSFRPKTEDSGDGNGWADFRGRSRSNETHASKTDPEARLFRKGAGKEAKLAFMAHVLMENRSGLVTDVEMTEATGHAEREAALTMVERSIATESRVTLGADAAYDARDFVAECRAHRVTPHVAQKKYSAIDTRTTRHDGYGVSQTIRKRIEQIFGWFKTVGGLRKTRHRGVARNQLAAEITATAYNLVRLGNLMPANE